MGGVVHVFVFLILVGLSSSFLHSSEGLVQSSGIHLHVQVGGGARAAHAWIGRRIMLGVGGWAGGGTE